jgi:hypothetical protein
MWILVRVGEVPARTSFSGSGCVLSRDFTTRVDDVMVVDGNGHIAAEGRRT